MSCGVDGLGLGVTVVPETDCRIGQRTKEYIKYWMKCYGMDIARYTHAPPAAAVAIIAVKTGVDLKHRFWVSNEDIIRNDALACNAYCLNKWTLMANTAR